MANLTRLGSYSRTTSGRRRHAQLRGARIALLLGALLLAGSAASGQQLEFSSSLNPVGSGARATGMGGAFIAVADDATAASWNPAGLIHLERPELSAAFSYFNRGQSYDSSSHPELAGAGQSVDAADLNYASVAYPFQALNRNMTVSLNYQRLFDMNKHLNINYRSDLGGGSSFNDRIDFTQKGYLSALSPAIAIQVLPRWYFGATVNIWDDFAGTCSWKNRYLSTGTGDLGGIGFNESTQWTNTYTFSGLNANLGLLYRIGGGFSVGMVGKTPFVAEVVRTTNLSTAQSFPTEPGADVLSNSATTKHFKMSMPASYGVGISYRHSDRLTVALDLYRTEWSGFKITDSSGTSFNPITGAPLNQASPVAGSFENVKPRDTTQVRLGAEYLFIGDKATIPLRGGFFYDPEPGFTSIDDYYGLALGSGIALGDFAFDISYQYRWSNRASGDIPQPGISAEIRQHTVMASLIYYLSQRR